MKTIITRATRTTYLFVLFAFISIPFTSLFAVPIPTVYDFDETDLETILADDFNAGPTDDNFDYSDDQGLSGSGAVLIDGGNNVWTARQTYEAPNTLDQTYTVSGYFYNSTIAGYGSLGFSSLATSTPVAPYTTSEKGLGVSFHGSEGNFVNNGQSIEELVWDGGELPEGWYHMSLTVVANGDTTYDLQFDITESDTDGNLGDPFTSHTYTNAENENVAFANAVYGYFGAASTRFDYVDEFSIEAEQMTLTPLNGAGTEEDPWELTQCYVLENDGYYVIANNIESVDRDCLIIEAHDVEIDGDGYTISGNGSTVEQEFQAITSTGYERIRIMHVVLEGFYDGITLWGSPSGPSEIFDVTVRDMMDDGIQADGAVDLTISENIISDVGDDGIDIGYESDDFNEPVAPSEEIVIRDNQITDIGDSGIEVESAIDIVITENTITDVSDNGIHMTWFGPEYQSSAVEITDNTLNEISDTGIDVYGVAGGTITGNSLYAGQNGISIESSSDIEVTDNIVQPLVTDAYIIPSTEFNFVPIDIESATLVDEDILYDDGGDYALFDEDDDHVRYELPFTFNFQGRDITSINVTTNGSIELLEDGEFCGGGSTLNEERHFECDEYGVYQEIQHGDILYASFDDLSMESLESDYVAIFNMDDESVVVEWFGTTYDDEDENSYTSEDHPVHFQVVLYPDGNVEWNFNEMNFVDYGYSMFTGAYDGEADALYYAGVAISEEEVSYAADLSGADEFEQTEVATSFTGINVFDVTDTDIFHNRITADKWMDVADMPGVDTIQFDDGDQGNTYYFVDGRGAWEEYNITDSDGDGYADKGDDLPFREATLGAELWEGEGSDAHPATEIVKKSKRKGGSVSNRVNNLMRMGKTEEAQKLVAEFPNAFNGDVAPVTLPSIVPSFPRNLTLGDTGSDVRDLQRFLNSKGYIITNEGPGSPGNETERFGELTRAALIRFQRENNLQPAIGYFGPLTRALIASMSALTSTIPAPAQTPVPQSESVTPVRDLDLGMSGDDVLQVQNYLITQNVGPAARALKANGASGYFGELTKAAVIEFQKAKGITPTSGRVGPLTRAAMGM